MCLAHLCLNHAQLSSCAYNSLESRYESILPHFYLNCHISKHSEAKLTPRYLRQVHQGGCLVVRSCSLSRLSLELESSSSSFSEQNDSSCQGSILVRAGGALHVEGSVEQMSSKLWHTHMPYNEEDRNKNTDTDKDAASDWVSPLSTGVLMQEPAHAACQHVPNFSLMPLAGRSCGEMIYRHVTSQLTISLQGSVIVQGGGYCDMSHTSLSHRTTSVDDMQRGVAVQVTYDNTNNMSAFSHTSLRHVLVESRHSILLLNAGEADSVDLEDVVILTSRDQDAVHVHAFASVSMTSLLVVADDHAPPRVWTPYAGLRIESSLVALTHVRVVGFATGVLFEPATVTDVIFRQLHVRRGVFGIWVSRFVDQWRKLGATSSLDIQDATCADMSQTCFRLDGRNILLENALAQDFGKEGVFVSSSVPSLSSRFSGDGSEHGMRGQYPLWHPFVLLRNVTALTTTDCTRGQEEEERQQGQEHAGPVGVAFYGDGCVPLFLFLLTLCSDDVI